MKNFLSNILPFWDKLSIEEQEELCNSAVKKCSKKGETVFNPLKNQAGLKLIKQGKIRIMFPTSNGGELLLYSLSAGDICILSVLNLMKQFDWDIYAEAQCDCTLVTIPEACYMNMSKRNAAITEFNQQALVARLGEVIQIVSHAALASTEERVADLLLRYEDQEGTSLLLLTHGGIAKDIGSVREVVSRILKQFEQRGLVRLGRGKIMVLDRQGLIFVKKGNA